MKENPLKLFLCFGIIGLVFGEILPQPIQIQSVNGRLDATLVAGLFNTVVVGETVIMKCYNGSYVAPTLVVKPGDWIYLTVVNQLTESTNIHFHGMQVSPLGKSDNIFRFILPGQTFTYEVEVPLDHPPGLHFYHSHDMFAAQSQVRNGMSGFIVVGDVLQPFPQFQNIQQVQFMLRDFNLTASGSVDDSIAVARKNINGEINSTLAIAPNEVQLWRFCDSSQGGYYELFLDNVPFQILAIDGNTRTSLMQSPIVSLSPGNRADVILIGPPEGVYTLRTNYVDTGHHMTPTQNPEQTLLTLISTGTPRDLPSYSNILPAQVEIDHKKVVAVRQFLLSEKHHTEFFINGDQFDNTRVDTTVLAGTVERWEIINNSMEDHDFHIHQVPFQVETVNDVPVPFTGMQDIVNLKQKPYKVSILVKWPNTPGKFVYHCHILKHEENGMMGIVEVVIPNNDNTPFSIVEWGNIHPIPALIFGVLGGAVLLAAGMAAVILIVKKKWNRTPKRERLP